MAEYSSIPETKEHIFKVEQYCKKMADEIKQRGKDHDASKIKSPEVEYYDIATPKLKKLEYGTPEYKKSLEEIKPALDHHYAENRHHPEHFKDGIAEMTLVDVCEMFCDWLAATKRTKDGDIFKSIDISKGRFNIPDALCKIFENTAKEVFGEDKK